MDHQQPLSPHFLLGPPQGWKCDDPTGQAHCSPLQLYKPCSWRQPGAPRRPDRVEQRPRGQSSLEPEMEGSVGRGDGGRTRGPLSGLPERLWMGECPSPSPRCCCNHRIKRLFSNAAGGAIMGTCFWKATWQPVLTALKMVLPSISRNLS